ncbi:MAG: fibronectin type III domain-containing protein [Bacteroidota bacterium]
MLLAAALSGCGPRPKQEVPASPSDLFATVLSASSIRLIWTDNSTNETSFKIERSTSSSGGFTQIATVAANVVTYDATGLSPGTTYYFRVRASNTAGNSGYSNTASATTNQALGILRIVNNTKYDIVTLKLNNQEQLTYGYVVLVGNYCDIPFTSSGTVSYYIANGFYDTYNMKNEMFCISGNTTVTLGQTTTLTFNNPTLAQVLSGFKSYSDWLGDYWQGLSLGYCYFRFHSNGTWQLYDRPPGSSGYTLVASGSVILVNWDNYDSFISFKLSSSGAVIQLPYPFSDFYLNNGPPDWPTIHYVKQ